MSMKYLYFTDMSLILSFRSFVQTISVPKVHPKNFRTFKDAWTFKDAHGRSFLDARTLMDVHFWKNAWTRLTRDHALSVTDPLPQRDLKFLKKVRCTEACHGVL
jgi:hypothetical protein